MKIITIGDLHGKDFWREIDFNSHDKVIFVGDYVDSLEHSGTEILSNLESVILLKKKDPEKIILLLGNHDIQYMYYPKFRCSGFRPEQQPALSLLFKDNKHLFQVAFQIGKHLWTHAGISNQWYARHLKTIREIWRCFPEANLADVLNAMSHTTDHVVLHTIGKRRGGVQDEPGGITWADKSETENDFLEGYHQIVGHLTSAF